MRRQLLPQGAGVLEVVLVFGHLKLPPVTAGPLEGHLPVESLPDAEDHEVAFAGAAVAPPAPQREEGLPGEVASRKPRLKMVVAPPAAGVYLAQSMQMAVVRPVEVAFPTQRMQIVAARPVGGASSHLHQLLWR